MNTARETIYAALFSKVSGIAGIVTASRRLWHWSDVPPASQPALYMAQRSETAVQLRGVPPKWTLAVDLYLYAYSGNDHNAIPAQKLNPLIDAIETALLPSPGGFQTLGGLVSHCWIAGKIETDEGFLGPQAVAIIPIEIVTS